MKQRGPREVLFDIQKVLSECECGPGPHLPGCEEFWEWTKDTLVTLAIQGTQGSRYTLDDEPVEIAEFVDHNDFELPEVLGIIGCRVGESITYGGGAAATFVLRRVA